MKRRLKNEIYNKKKFQQVDRNSEEAREFEESLLKLAQLAKNRVKLSDFTIRDKCNLLDLFVNNEKTLLKIYEALFPHRAPGQGASTDKNAVNPNKERQITLRNSQLSNQLAQAVQYNYPIDMPGQDLFANSHSILGAGAPNSNSNVIPMIGAPQTTSGNRTLGAEFGSFRNQLMNNGQNSNQQMMLQNSNVDALAQNIALRQQVAAQY